MSKIEDVISVRSVNKSFGDIKAVSHFNLQIASGTIYALIGPNGAGKSTLIKMMVGLLAPDTGKIIIGSSDISTDPLQARHMFAYVSDDPSPYDYLSGEEFLAMTGNLRGMNGHDIPAKIRSLIDVFSLQEIYRQPMSQYSRGNKQKIAFLAAIMAQPKVLFIDEPIVGLDPTSIAIFGKELIKFKKGGGTVFFATHTLPFAQEFADIVGVMKKGELIAEKNIRSHTDLGRIYELAVEKNE